VIRNYVSKLSSILGTNLTVFLILSVVIIVFFGRLTHTFYQQDEWNAVGLIYSEGIEYIFPYSYDLADFILVKGRMLSSLIFYLLSVYFPFQNTYLAILAIILHIITSFLVFLLARLLVRNSLLAFLGALFFALNAVSHGAITWSAIAISAAGSSILVLLSLLFFFKYLESSRQKFLLLTGFALYFSLWFKEAGLYLFLFFPVAALFFKKYTLKSYIQQFWWFLVPFFAIVGYRIIELRFGPPDPNLYISGASDSFFLTILIRLIIYPLTSFSLMFVPGQPFIEFAREVLRDNYKFFASSPNNLLISQSVILDLLAVILTGFIVFVLALFSLKESRRNIKTVLFWLILTFVSFSPYVVLSKDFSYLESRYYYLPVASGAILFSWLLLRIWAVSGRKLFFAVALPLSLVFIFWHASAVKSAIEEQVVFSNWRTSFIKDLKSTVPTLSGNKNVFYITGDRNYWADGNRIPFQQGSGYTLMVLYYTSGKIPKEFLKDGYLFDIGSQGYMEIGDLGFGYFWNKNDLEKALINNNLSPDNVIPFYFDNAQHKLVKTKFIM